MKKNCAVHGKKQTYYYYSEMACHALKDSSEPMVYMCAAGLVSNNSQCQLTRIRATAHARSRKVCGYLFSYLFLRLRLGLRLGLVVRLGLGLIIPTCRKNRTIQVNRVHTSFRFERIIWQCDIFGTTPACVYVIHLGCRS